MVVKSVSYNNKNIKVNNLKITSITENENRSNIKKTTKEAQSKKNNFFTTTPKKIKYF